MYTYMYITFFISIYVNQIRRPPAVANAGRRLGRGESQSLVRHICDWLLLMCKLVSMKVPSLAISRCFRPSVCWFFFGRATEIFQRSTVTRFRPLSCCCFPSPSLAVCGCFRPSVCLLFVHFLWLPCGPFQGRFLGVQR